MKVAVSGHTHLTDGWGNESGCCCCYCLGSSHCSGEGPLNGEDVGGLLQLSREVDQEPILVLEDRNYCVDRDLIVDFIQQGEIVKRVKVESFDGLR